VKIETSKSKHSLENVGAKALSLCFLKENNFNVPNFYFIDFEILNDIKNNKLSIEKFLSDWKQTHQIQENTLWAVRSSANVEDGAKDSYAGLFETKINVPFSQLATAIHQVLEAYDNVAVQKYSANSEQFSYGIIIQEMIRSEFSGVIFSHNPFDVEKEEIFINLIPGLGENLVSGKDIGIGITVDGTKIEFQNIEEDFSGEIFKNGKLEPISYTGESLVENINPFLQELINSTRKLSKLKKQPVDIEFTISNHQIYWLQIRPITSKLKQFRIVLDNSKLNQIVWDNSNIGENYPNLSSPLTISFVKYTYYIAYAEMCKFLGMRQKQFIAAEESLKNMADGIKGALYYNVTAWQQLLYQLPFGRKLSKQYTKALGMEEAAFDVPNQSSSVLSYSTLFFNVFKAFISFNKHRKRFISGFENTISEYQNKNYSSFTHTDLIQEYKNLQKNMIAHWVAPMLNGLFTLAVFSLLKKIIKNSRLNAKYPNFINDILFSQGDVISVKIVKDFQLLIDEIQENKQLFTLFNENDEIKIQTELKESFPSFAKKIESYLSDFGERCDEGELKIETVNYKENPLSFISFLKKNSKNTRNYKKEHSTFNYREIIEENYKFNYLKRIILAYLIKISILRIKDRENFRFMRTKTFHLVRRIFRAIDSKLLNEKIIEQHGDSHYLTFDELIEKPEIENYKSLISERKKDYEGYKNLKIENRYHQIGENFEVVEFFSDKEIKNSIKAVGCSSGLLTKQVLVISEENVNSVDTSDKILVANYFEPGWINLFSKAAGIISEKGNLLSHTAILCREMGIPSIVGAKGILKRVKTGDIIKMNGASGEVFFSN